MLLTAWSICANIFFVDYALLVKKCDLHGLDLGIMQTKLLGLGDCMKSEVHYICSDILLQGHIEILMINFL